MGFVDGTLDPGEVRAAPLIHATVALAQEADLVVIDAPPGTSCSAVAAIEDVDLVLLVCEPTPFGLHDLELSLQMCDALGLETVAVINRSDVGDDGVRSLLVDEGVPLLAEVPFDREIAAACAAGVLAATRVPDFAATMDTLAGQVSRGTPRAAPMRQIAIITGKGGTGKTSLIGAFVRLAGRSVAVDADVDAANLALLLVPGEDGSWRPFEAGRRAVIDAAPAAARAGRASRPVASTPSGTDEHGFESDPIRCEGCGACAQVCEEGAVSFRPNRAGSWTVRADPVGRRWFTPPWGWPRTAPGSSWPISGERPVGSPPGTASTSS